MHFNMTTICGAVLVAPEKRTDQRGYFTRARCSSEFRAANLPDVFVQTNISYNISKGTFRGLHFQVPPSKESKLVRCIRGSIADVIVDLRPDSDTFLKHEWFILDENDLHALYVPAGVGHGFLTQSDDVMVLYEMGDYFAPELSRGVRVDDPLLGIKLPSEIAVINPRDAAYPDLDVKMLDCFRGEQH